MSLTSLHGAQLCIQYIFKSYLIVFILKSWWFSRVTKAMLVSAWFLENVRIPSIPSNPEERTHIWGYHTSRAWKLLDGVSRNTAFLCSKQTSWSKTPEQAAVVFGSSCVRFGDTYVFPLVASHNAVLCLRIKNCDILISDHMVNFVISLSQTFNKYREVLRDLIARKWRQSVISARQKSQKTFGLTYWQTFVSPHRTTSGQNERGNQWYGVYVLILLSNWQKCGSHWCIENDYWIKSRV